MGRALIRALAWLAMFAGMPLACVDAVADAGAVCYM
jgi:hypothetical protein